MTGGALAEPSIIVSAVILGPVVQNEIVGKKSSRKPTYESRKDTEREQEKL